MTWLILRETPVQSRGIEHADPDFLIYHMSKGPYSHDWYASCEDVSSDITDIKERSLIKALTVR